MPKCPSCGKELTSVYAARSVELQKDGDKWIEKNIFSSGCSCPQCNEELPAEVTYELDVPLEWQ